MPYFASFVTVERKPGKRGRGRPPADNRNVINGILWRLCTGAPWRGVPEKDGNWNSIYRCFRRWSASGVWESVAIALAETMAESEHYNIDSTTVRARVSAARGKGGFIDELLAARGAGSPVKFIASVMPEAAPSPPISRRARRRTVRHMISTIDLPERAPDALIADKAYDADAIRDKLKRRGIRPVIPSKVRSNKDDPLPQASLPTAQPHLTHVRSPQDQSRYRHSLRPTRRQLP